MVDELVMTAQDKPAKATKQRNRIFTEEEKEQKNQMEEGLTQVEEE